MLPNSWVRCQAWSARTFELKLYLFRTPKMCEGSPPMRCQRHLPKTSRPVDASHLQENPYACKAQQSPVLPSKRLNL